MSPGPISISPSGCGSGSPWGAGPAVPTREAWRTWQGSTTVAIPCAEASNPGSSGSARPAHRFQVHSTHELLVALFVFDMQSPSTQDTHSPWKGTSDLAPSAASRSLLTGRLATSVTESDCQVVPGACGRQHTVQAQELVLQLQVRPPRTPQAETTVPYSSLPS